MPLRKPTGTFGGSDLDRAARLVELEACIAEAEAASSAQAATVAVLIRTGYDTAEAVQTLRGALDALAILREVRDHLRAG